MTQRTVKLRAVDEEMRRYIQGTSELAEGIKATLDAADPLTRELVLFRAEGGDYRLACRLFNVSSTTYYNRLANFRRELISVITANNL